MSLLLDPFAPLFELSRDLDRMLGSAEGSPRTFTPPADVLAGKDEVTVVMDVPGFTQADVEIELVEDVLTVRGERKFPYATSHDGHSWQRLERGFGTFERVLRLPKGLDAERIDATLADGVLTLRIPMPEARKPRRIEIGTAPPTIESGNGSA